MSNVKDVTPVRLAKWLAAQEDSAVVGKTTQATSCPLARCLMDLNNTDYASVGARMHTIGVSYGQYRHLDNKPWQRRFIHAIDALRGRVVQSPVTAQEARAALLVATEFTLASMRVQEILRR